VGIPPDRRDAPGNSTRARADTLPRVGVDTCTLQVDGAASAGGRHYFAQGGRGSGEDHICAHLHPCLHKRCGLCASSLPPTCTHFMLACVHSCSPPPPLTHTHATRACAHTHIDTRLHDAMLAYRYAQHASFMHDRHVRACAQDVTHDRHVRACAQDVTVASPSFLLHLQYPGGIYTVCIYSLLALNTLCGCVYAYPGALRAVPRRYLYLHVCMHTPELHLPCPGGIYTYTHTPGYA